MRSAGVFVALVGLAGCAQFRPPAGGDGEGGGGGGGGGGGAGGGGATACKVHGFPYSYADEHGSKVSDTDSMDPLRVQGKLADGGEVYAGVGVAFKEPKGPYDASGSTGISFIARRSAGSTAFVRFKVPDASTDPDGKVCTDCYNDFGIPFQVTEAWTRYEVRFTDLAQEADWGAPRPAAVDPAKLYGLQWQVAVPGAELDLSIDEVAFLGCRDES